MSTQPELKFKFWLASPGRMHTNPVVVYNCLLRQAVYDDKRLRETPGAPDFPLDYIGRGDRFLQFTGLRDHSGREIYEGDIVRYGTEDGIAITKIVRKIEDDESMWASGLAFELVRMDDYSDEDEENGVAYETEVLGNIHEHPELLRPVGERATGPEGATEGSSPSASDDRSEAEPEGTGPDRREGSAQTTTEAEGKTN